MPSATPPSPSSLRSRRRGSRHRRAHPHSHRQRLTLLVAMLGQAPLVPALAQLPKARQHREEQLTYPSCSTPKNRFLPLHINVVRAQVAASSEVRALAPLVPVLLIYHTSSSQTTTTAHRSSRPQLPPRHQTVRSGRQ